MGGRTERLFRHPCPPPNPVRAPAAPATTTHAHSSNYMHSLAYRHIHLHKLTHALECATASACPHASACAHARMHALRTRKRTSTQKLSHTHMHTLKKALYMRAHAQTNTIFNTRASAGLAKLFSGVGAGMAKIFLSRVWGYPGLLYLFMKFGSSVSTVRYGTENNYTRTHDATCTYTHTCTHNAQTSVPAFWMRVVSFASSSSESFKAGWACKERWV